MKDTAYRFVPIAHCEMCGVPTDDHKILGRRMNRSQGANPRLKRAITTTIMRCSNCRLIYCDPQPIPINIQDHYDILPESYWKPEYFYIDPAYFSHELGKFAELKGFQKGMRALDVGAGLGKCMLSLNAFGFDSYGLEPSNSFYYKALDQYHISPQRLTLGMIEEVEYENEFFDFITFGAVLEHLYQPADSIIRAMGWLKPGGLMHLEVPSADYLIARLLNLYYGIIGTSYVTNTSPMHEPFHLYEFTRDSFEKLSRRTQTFKVVYSENFICSAEPFPKVLQPILKKAMGLSNTGMQLSVWLRKFD